MMRRFFMGSLLLLSAVLVLCSLVLGWALGTTSGATWLVKQVAYAEPRLQATVIAGRILTGVTFDKLHWDDADIQLSVSDGVLSWNSGCLLLKQCDVVAQATSVEGGYANTQSYPGPNTEGQPFALPFSRLNVQIEVGQTQLKMIDQSLMVSGLNLSAHITDAQILVDDISIETVVSTAVKSETLIQQVATGAPKATAPLLSPFDIDGIPVDLKIKRLRIGSVVIDDSQPELNLSNIDAIQWSLVDSVFAAEYLSLQVLDTEVSVSGRVQLLGKWPTYLNLSVTHREGKDTEVNAQALITGDFEKIDWSLALQSPVALHATGSFLPQDTELPITGVLYWEQAPAMSWLPPELVIQAGILNFDGSLANNMAAIALETSVRTTHDNAITDIALKARWQNNSFTIDQAVFSQLAGSATAAGNISMGSESHWSVSVTARDFASPAALSNFAAILNGTFGSKGTYKEGYWTTALSTRDFQILWNDAVYSATGDIQLNSDLQWNTELFRISGGANQIQISGGFDTQWDGNLTLDVQNASDFKSGIEGTVQAKVSVFGPLETPQIAFNLSASDLNWQNNNVSTMGLLGHLYWQEAPQIALSVETTQAHIGGQQISQANLTIDGSADHHSISVSAASDFGNVATTLSGSLENFQQWNGVLNTALLTSEWGNWSLDHPASVELDIEKSNAYLGQHCWSHVAAQVCADQRLILGRDGKLNVSFTQINLKQFAAYMPDEVITTGVMAGQISAQWEDASLVAAQATFVGQQGAIVVASNLSQPLTLPFDNWTFQAKQVVDGWTLDATIAGKDFGVLKSQANLSGDPIADTPLAATAILTDFPIARLTPMLPASMSASGRLSAQFQVTGSVGNPYVKGSVDLHDGRLEDANLPINPVDVGLNLSILNDQVSMAGQFSTEQGSGAFSGQGEWRAGNWWADFALSADDIELFEQNLSRVQFEFSGGHASHQLTLQAAHELATMRLDAIGGLTDNQHWLGTLESAQIESNIGTWLTDQPVAIDVGITEAIVVIDPHCWSHKAAKVCADAPLSLGLNGQAKLSVNNIDMEHFAQYLPAGITASGLIDGAASVRWADSTLLSASAIISGQPGTVTNRLDLEHSLAFPYDYWELHAEQVGADWVFDATILGQHIGKLNSQIKMVGTPTTASPLLASITLQDMPIALFSPLLGPAMEVSGNLSAIAQLTGSIDTPELEGTLNVNEGVFKDLEMPLSIDDVGIKLTFYNGKAELLGDFAMGRGSGVVSGQGEWRDGDWWAGVALTADQIVLFEQNLPYLQLKFAGGQSDHVIDLQLSQELGVMSLSLSGGLRENQHWIGDLTTAQLQSEFGTWIVEQRAKLDVNIGERAATVAPHCWLQSTARLCATQVVELGLNGSANLTVSNLDVNPFSAYMPEGITVEGLVDGALSARWVDMKPYDVSATLSGQPGTVKLRAGSAETLLIPYDHWQVQASQISNDWSFDASVTGQEIGVLTSHADVTGMPSVEAPMAFTAQLRDMPIALFSALIDPNMTVSGKLSAQVQMNGSATSPKVNGALSLSDGKFEAEGVPVAVDDILVEVILDQELADIKGSFNIGSGKGKIEGSATLQDTGWISTIEMSGANMAIIDPMMTLEVSPRITLLLSETTVDIKGVIDVPTGAIKIKSLPESAVSLSNDVIVINENVPLNPTPDFKVTTNIDVVLGKSVWIEAYGLKSQLIGSITVRQKDIADPQLYGQIETQNGSFKALGAHLDIRRGKLVFSGPMDRPMLDLEAVRVVNNTTAGILAKGIVTEPEITLFSEPAMTQAEILSYIIRGQPLDGGAISEGLLATKVAMGIGIYGSDSPLNSVSEKLGIEDFNIDAEGSADSARIALAGYLSPRLYFKYGVGVMNAANEITLRYKLLPRLFLESITGINSAVDLIYTFEF